jgi:signal peptidase II
LSEVRPRPRDVRVGSSPDGLAPISVAERSLAASGWQWTGLVAVALAALAADQLTKWLVSSRIALGESYDVLGPLKISHVQNSGIAFGLFSQATVLVIVLTTAIVGWMLFFFARSGAHHPLLPAALGLVIGGSASNLVDRIRIGHVTDFIDIGRWPAFNLADSFICVGVVALLVALFVSDSPEARSSNGRPPAPDL